MSDNIYKALFGDNAPFGGMANINYFDRTIKGQIEKVHYEDLFVSDGKNQILNQNNYRTVDIKWLEGKPYISTNVHIPELVSYKGYGLNFLPSKGDIVYASFDSSNNPVITNIVARCSAYEHGVLNAKENAPVLNKYGDPLLDTVIPSDIRPTPIRYIKEGEISLISKDFAELYLDKEGAAKLITRQVLGGQQMGDRLWELSIGESIVDEGTKEVKTLNNGNIQFQILGHQCKTNLSINDDGYIVIENRSTKCSLDPDGKIVIEIKKGEKITIVDDKISLGNGNLQPAVLGDDLLQQITNIIETFNNHTHIGNLGFPTSNSLTPMISSDFLSDVVEVK